MVKINTYMYTGYVTINGPLTRALFITYCVGHVSGGCLKTSDQADKESLQANWFEADTSILPKKLHLRAYDILPLIDAGKAWQRSKLLTSLPVDVGHVSASVRLVVAHCTSSSDEGQVSVLMEGSTVSSTRLPVYVIDKAFSDPIRGAVKVTAIVMVYIVVIVSTCDYYSLLGKCPLLSKHPSRNIARNSFLQVCGICVLLVQQVSIMHTG